MRVLLAALPVALPCLAMACGVRSTRAALLGLAAVVVALATAYRTAWGRLGETLWDGLPTMIEVALILLGGIVLARLMDASGAQQRLSEWLVRAVASPVAAVLLVVHGVTPFIESVTGFGVGAMVAVPLLLHLGLTPARAAVVGLLGLLAVPWGAMGPGLPVAGVLGDVSAADLSNATAVWSVLPFVLCGVAAVAISRVERRPSSWPLTVASALVLWVGVMAASWLLGPTLAGAVGAVVSMGVHLLVARWGGRGRSATSGVEAGDAEAGDAEAGHAAAVDAANSVSGGEDAPGTAAPGLLRELTPYAVLLTGILVTTLTLRAAGLDAGATGYLASPALWLLVTCLVSVPLLRLSHGRARGAAADAVRRWRPVVVPTTAYLLLGLLMVAGGLTAPLAEAAAGVGRGYLLVSPGLGAVCGFITGSNIGAAALLAAPQSAAARALGADPLTVLALHTVAASLLTMASPARVALAIQMCPPQDRPSEGAVMRPLLAVSAVVVAMLGVAGFVVGG